MTESSEVRGADPRLTANIYCADHLDRVVGEVVVPLWRGLEAERAAGRVWLWCMRYGRGGEHLKIRLHDPEEVLDLDSIKAEIEQSAAELFTALGEPPEDEDKKNTVRTAVPPIDVEDREKEPREDRSVLFTTYTRHRLSLGDEDMFGSDRYCVVFTRAIAAACGVYFSSFDAGTKKAAAKRLVTVFTGVTATLWSLDMDVERRASYLAYHRDWLLRFSLVRTDPKVDPADRSRNRFNQKLMSMAPERRQPLMEQAWRYEDHPMEGAAEGLHKAVVEMAEYAAPKVRALPRALDPDAQDYFDSILFKLLQSFANACGLRVLEEAWVHHLLHSAMVFAPARHG